MDIISELLALLENNIDELEIQIEKLLKDLVYRIYGQTL